MKNTRILLFAIIFTFINTISFGQTGFKWDVIIDSLNSNQNELYSKTKLFIAETWNSAQNVIQNDDKAGGIILVKALNIQILNFQTLDHKWVYKYTVKFFMKNNRCRIIIDNVFCESAMCRQEEWPLLQPSFNYPSSKGLRITGINEKRYMQLMTSLEQDLQNIVSSYKEYVKEPLINNSDW